MNFSFFYCGSDCLGLQTGLALALHDTWVKCDFLPEEVLLMVMKCAFPVDYK